DIESTEFETTFRGLQQAVLAHAEAEELTEFAALQGELDESDLTRARGAVELIESSSTSMEEPFAAMYDRAVDALLGSAAR
ncbi:MAG: hypothetical protein ACRDNS_24355, partial [Trebonia sp.]